jgi:hypothetical protein
MAYGRGWKAIVRIVGDFGSPILTVGASQKTSVASASIVSHLVTAPPCVIARLATFVARSTGIVPLIARVVLQRRGNRGFLLDAWLGTRPLPQIRGPLRRPQMLPVSHPPLFAASVVPQVSAAFDIVWFPWCFVAAPRDGAGLS